MAKRFTDSTKWQNPWYRKMPWQYRDLWDYFLDTCDFSGVWRVDFEIAGLIIGAEFTKEGVLSYFTEKIIVISEDKWFFPSFITFQYGNLHGSSKVKKSVIKQLINHGIDPETLNPSPRDSLGLARGGLTPKDKDKEKEKEKDKGRGIGGNLKNKFAFEKEIDDVYQIYPRKSGKLDGMRSLRSQIKNEKDLEDFKQAVKNYTAIEAAKNSEQKFIKQFSTFVGSQDVPRWREFINIDATQISEIDKPKTVTEHNNLLLGKLLNKLKQESDKND